MALRLGRASALRRPCSSGRRRAGVALAGNIAYVAQQGPAVRWTVPLGPPGTGQDVAIANGLAFVAANTLGLRIYDTFAPSAPPATTIPIVGDALAVAIDGPMALVADFPATVSVVGW